MIFLSVLFISFNYVFFVALGAWRLALGAWSLELGASVKGRIDARQFVARSACACCLALEAWCLVLGAWRLRVCEIATQIHSQCLG